MENKEIINKLLVTSAELITLANQINKKENTTTENSDVKSSDNSKAMSYTDWLETQKNND